MRTSFVIGRDRGVGSGALGTLGPLARLGSRRQGWQRHSGYVMDTRT